MIKEAVLHINTESYIYPVSRKSLVVRIRTAKKDIKQCSVIYWSRTTPDAKKQSIMECVQSDELFDYYETTLNFSKVARYQKYYFLLEDNQGNVCYYSVNGFDDKEPMDGHFEFLYANENDVVKVPEWAKGIIYYQIFPERFCDGDSSNNADDCMDWGTTPTRENYMGGDLEGIHKQIPYLKDLGIECLYLNPIFEADFNHKYATTDYYKIDPMFGTNEKFKQFVDACHGADIKVVLDGVFNHTGIHFKPFQDVLKNGRASKYFDWFHINAEKINISHHDYECVGAYKYMPKLNSANKEVRAFILDVMDYWISNYGIDGWRLDVADEVDATVWREARLILKEKYPEILLLGETWGYGDKLLAGNQLDAVMNYMFRDAARDYFAKEAIDVETFNYRINHMLAGYKKETNQVMYNLLDSHDTERFLTMCDGDLRKLKLAAAFQILFVGAPAIYYGDEIGLTGMNDPDCRKCMIWDEKQNQELKDWYKTWINIRKEYPEVRKGRFQTIFVDNDKDVYGFVRQLNDEKTYVFLRKGPKDTREVMCPVLEHDKDYFDVVSKEPILNAQGVLWFTMDSYSLKVISTKCKN
ncbi:MAG: alpha amylase N-terminal ig-like domain-containing protein [Lachnospiraceae bacterium]|nr:alpha amylase N-terminal ig-like domain-containing protein [Lachnospiraceae bacterium]